MDRSKQEDLHGSIEDAKLSVRLPIFPFVFESKVSPLKSMVIIGCSQVQIKDSTMSRAVSFLKNTSRTSKGLGKAILLKSSSGSGNVKFFM